MNHTKLHFFVAVKMSVTEIVRAFITVPVSNCGTNLTGLDWVIMIISIYSASILVRTLRLVHYFSSEYKIEKAFSSIQSLITEATYLVLPAFDNSDIKNGYLSINKARNKYFHQNGKD